MEFGKVNYFRFNLRRDFLSARRLIRAALVEGESNIHLRIRAKIMMTIKPDNPCRNNPLLIPPSMMEIYL